MEKLKREFDEIFVPHKSYYKSKVGIRYWSDLWTWIMYNFEPKRANPVEDRVSFAEPNVGDKYYRIIIQKDEITSDELIFGDDPIRDAQAIITGNLFLDKEKVDFLCGKAKELFHEFEARSNVGAEGLMRLVARTFVKER